MKVLSIDAWAGMERGQWDWNDWHTVGHIDEFPPTTRGLLKLMRSKGYLSEFSKGKVCLDDDGYNVVICKKSNKQPIFAIEYGGE